MKLIGLTGRSANNTIASCGKDTVASILQKETGYVVYGFADPIYRMLRSGLDLSVFEYHDKNKSIEWLDDITIRRLLETLGTDWGRNTISEDIWIKVCERYIAELDDDVPGVIIKDIRFENEREWLYSKGGRLIHIISNNTDTNNHISNQALSIKENDLVLHNTSTISILVGKIKLLRKENDL